MVGPRHKNVKNQEDQSAVGTDIAMTVVKEMLSDEDQSDTSIRIVTQSARSGNTQVIGGDSIVSRPNTTVILGNTSVVSGDTTIIQGGANDSLVSGVSMYSIPSALPSARGLHTSSKLPKTGLASNESFESTTQVTPLENSTNTFGLLTPRDII